MSLPISPHESASKQKGRVLIVDDEVELTKALSEMLAKQGYETSGFTDGKHALETLRTQKFDVLLADLMMPEMDGIRLLKSALEIDPQLVGIIMTGQGTVQTAVEAMKSGAFDYILKPFKLNTVLTTLARSLEVSRLRSENSHLRELLKIYELGRVVSSTLDTGTIYEKTTELALQLTQADEASILVPVQTEAELVVVSTCCNGRTHLVGERAPMVGTIAGWVARHQEMLALDGEVDDPRFAPIHPRRDIRSAVSMPMVSGNKLVGVINVNLTRRPHPLTDGQVKGLSILGSIAASAVENARLHAETEKRLQRLSALRTIDLAITSSLDLRVTLNILLDQVAAQLDVDAAAVMLLDTQTQTLEYAGGRGFRTDAMERYKALIGVGYIGTAALERKTVLVPDLSQVGELDPPRAMVVAKEDIHALFAAPMIAKGEVAGVLAVFKRSPFEPEAEWVDFLDALAGQGAIAVESTRLFDHLQRSNQQLFLSYNATIEGWSRALDLRDKETEGHTQRVTEMTLKLAQAMGIYDSEDLVHIRRGALLHDIGKMGVPDPILLKAGDLTEEEWAIMRKHPKYAYELLYPIVYLRKALDIPYAHHEQWDGQGYPRGLKGEQIPLAARIFSVVDVWDALRSDRPYREGWTHEQVLVYIREQSGILFDPQVVEVFTQMIEGQGLSHSGDLG